MREKREKVFESIPDYESMSSATIFSRHINSLPDAAPAPEWAHSNESKGRGGSFPGFLTGAEKLNSGKYETSVR